MRASGVFAFGELMKRAFYAAVVVSCVLGLAGAPSCMHVCFDDAPPDNFSRNLPAPSTPLKLNLLACGCGLALS
jgi:hypothetical protein